MCKRYKTFVEGKENEVNFNEIELVDDPSYLEATLRG